MKYLFLLLFLPTSLIAQEVSYSPTSFKMWGATKQVQKIDIRYKFFQYTHVDIRSTQTDNLGYGVQQKNHGFFIAPRIHTLGFFASGGVGYFTKKLANLNGTHWNFVFETGFRHRIKGVSVGVKYSHISNGYQGRLNHGIDNLSLTIKL